MAKKSTHVTHEGSKERDELALILQKALNNRQKDGAKVAHFLGDEGDPSVISDWISTGSTTLDLAISNRPYGGLPVGRIIELNGLESTGKSLISAHIIAETQKKGGLAVMIDSENSAAPEFWTSLGVNVSNLLYAQYDCLEDMFGGMEAIIGEVRKTNADRLLTIIFDSVAGAPTRKELESDYGVDGYNTAKAIIVSKAMKKLTGLVGRQRILPVFTNQLRMNLAAMAFGDKYIVPGGKGLAYHASVRIRLSNIGKIKNANKMVIGNTIQAQVQKNRCGPPMRTARFDVHFDSGIQDLSSLLEFMKENGIVTGTKAGYTFKMPGVGDVKFNTDRFVELWNNTEEKFQQVVYEAVCENYIMKYRSPNSKIVEDAVYDEGSEEEVKEVVE
jgi:recombination protein RecA